jgi:hypothetical protein
LKKLKSLSNKEDKTLSIYETHKPAQGKGDYLKLKDGDRVKVRFTSEPAVVTYDGKRLRYQWVVFNRKDKKAQVYEAGSQVFGQLADLYPEWGEPTDFDVTISRSGSGQFDTSYTVTPSPKSMDLTAEEKALVDKALENFPGSKSRWLSDVEADGRLPEALKPTNESDEDTSLSDEDIPPEFR